MPTPIFAPAKINLSLQVLARRPDGYHELDSWMIKLDLQDQLDVNFEADPGISLSCPGTDLPCDQGNLVWRAVASFYEAVELAPAVKITLHKRIPAAAGLGGGSSDAATMLSYLNSHHGKPLCSARLMSLAKEIGADLPFLLSSYSSARAQGIGERLTALPPVRDCVFVLVNPNFAVSTPEIFKALQPPFRATLCLDKVSEISSKDGNYSLTTAGKTTILSGASRPEGRQVHLVNDLEPVTTELYPVLASLKKLLYQQGASFAAMTGSGPTMYALFATMAQAQSCLQAVQAQYDGYKCFICKYLPAQV